MLEKEGQRKGKKEINCVIILFIDPGYSVTSFQPLFILADISSRIRLAILVLWFPASGNPRLMSVYQSHIILILSHIDVVTAQGNK